METKLNNTVSVLGEYDGVPTSINSNVLVVNLIDGLTVTKSADKMVWADGVLTFTIEVDNQTEVTYTAPIITDVLDITLVDFVAESVMIDGVKAETSAYTYDAAAGTLKVTLSDIAAKGKSTITFQVTKKA